MNISCVYNNLKKVYEYLINWHVIEIFALLGFCFLTIPEMIHHFPWGDEANAWLIAKELNFSNILSTTKIEGHPCIWWLILTPVAKFNFHYPYSMLIINWLFAFAALIILWRLSPLNVFFKLSITFSPLIIDYYSIIARPYALCVLGLFLLCYLYPKQLKHPIWYTLLIILNIHLHFFSTLCALFFCLIFIYKLIKTYKLNIKKYIFLIFAILISMVLYAIPYIINQGYGFDGFKELNPPSLRSLIDFFTVPFDYKFFRFYIYLAINIYLLFTSPKDIKLFIIYINVAMVLFCKFIYPLNLHNLYFILVYIMIFYWLKEYSKKSGFFGLILFVALMILPLKTDIGYILDNHMYNHDNLNFIKQNIPPDATLYFNDWSMSKSMGAHLKEYEKINCVEKIEDISDDVHNYFVFSEDLENKIPKKNLIKENQFGFKIFYFE